MKIQKLGFGMPIILQHFGGPGECKFISASQSEEVANLMEAQYFEI